MLFDYGKAEMSSFLQHLKQLLPRCAYGHDCRALQQHVGCCISGVELWRRLCRSKYLFHLVYWWRRVMVVSYGCCVGELCGVGVCVDWLMFALRVLTAPRFDSPVLHYDEDTGVLWLFYSVSGFQQNRVPTSCPNGQSYPGGAINMKQSTG